MRYVSSMKVFFSAHMGCVGDLMVPNKHSVAYQVLYKGGSRVTRT